MIYLADNFGLCKGINKTLGLVYEIYEKELLKDEPKKIYVYNEIVHNDKVNKELADLGIEIINNINKVSKDDIVIISTYGASLEVYEYLKNNEIEYYDGTCSKVLKKCDEINKKYLDGYEIIIIGTKNSNEVTTLNSRCNNEAVIVSCERDLDNIANNSKKFIVSISKVSNKVFNDYVIKIKNSFHNCKIEVYDVFCNAFNEIEESSVLLAKKCDVVFVIGDNNNHKTNELYKSIKKYTSCYKFNDIEKFYDFLKTYDLKNKNIGLTASNEIPPKEVYQYKYLLNFLSFYQKIVTNLAKNQDTINSNLIKKEDNILVQDIIKEFVDLNQGGKYIRGVLIALGEYIASGKNLNYERLAYAYEMFQTSILIHDDIIDNAKFRRNKPTIPRRICASFLNKSNDKTYQMDTLKLANSLAICMGDFGFYEANSIMIKNLQDNPYLTKILDYFNEIVINTIKGETLDVYLSFKGKYNYYKPEEKDIMDIYHAKTSLYTVVGPFNLGYILGGKEISEDLTSILDKIGLCFQIKDDLMGIFSDSKIIGKSNTSDIEEYKQTMLYSHILNTLYRKNFLNIYGKKNINDKDLKKIRELLVKSGSYEYAVNMLNDLQYRCIEEIDNLNILDNHKDILKGLLLFINIRNK